MSQDRSYPEVFTTVSKRLYHPQSPVSYMPKSLSESPVRNSKSTVRGTTLINEREIPTTWNSLIALNNQLDDIARFKIRQTELEKKRIYRYFLQSNKQINREELQEQQQFLLQRKQQEKLNRIEEEKRLLLENADIVKAKLKSKDPNFSPGMKNLSIKKVLFADSSLANKLGQERLMKESIEKEKRRIMEEAEKMERTTKEEEVRNSTRKAQLATAIQGAFEPSFRTSIVRQSKSIGIFRDSGRKFDPVPETKAAGRANKLVSYNVIDGRIANPKDLINHSPHFKGLPDFLRGNYEGSAFQ
eukprot:TRINITY_DN71001_c1_g1_i1.p3 TRINITY_DN71001_c1_g1~~TRINITY_DN71001_c1_g1_i1.p3  ORF type:complete len:301 (+),score=28.91 TRINITY_DN71001_c1_g1_i1:1833-2735(+)